MRPTLPTCSQKPMQTSSKALAVGAFGARGTGKTAWLCQLIESMRPGRLLMWDFKDDPAIEHLGQPVHSLPDLARKADRETFKLRYVVDHKGDFKEQFEAFCEICLTAGNLVMYVAELPEVTAANKAPKAWRRCVNVGRLYRDRNTGEQKTLTIMADGQRTAECDKSFLNNLDITHSGRQNNLDDAQLLAKTMGVDYRDLMALPDLHWIEKRADSQQATRGVLTFAKKVAKKPAGK